MVDTLKMDKHLVHLLSFFNKMGLLPNIPCLVLRAKMH
jgi:hypothetical protein